MAAQAHECRESRTCCCSIQALEPDESCPVHGAGEWPPRCGVCGRFLKSVPPPELKPREVSYAGFVASLVSEGYSEEKAKLLADESREYCGWLNGELVAATLP